MRSAAARANILHRSQRRLEAGEAAANTGVAGATEWLPAGSARRTSSRIPSRPARAEEHGHLPVGIVGPHYWLRNLRAARLHQPKVVR